MNESELPPTAPPSRILQTRGTGRPLCAVCHAAPHLQDCPIVRVGLLVRDLAAHVGAFVAETRDTLEEIETILKE